MNLLERFELKPGEEIVVKNEYGATVVELRKSEKTKLSPDDVYCVSHEPIHGANMYHENEFYIPTNGSGKMYHVGIDMRELIKDRVKVSKEEFLQICRGEGRDDS